ncbi:hypothetical protein POX_f08245 [Penicillium oxalicum]|uniref:hypothetical protein n=1 Tax=Penicillium oxalicum TaxID=69781 RepID=UPI0020B8372D|nr:hypothetical protein POX_f08245 [Penicillium oxalicum]KAI2787865.1 hypothetical protein POX_f08245 [Penicillium oxalicum]
MAGLEACGKKDIFLLTDERRWSSTDGGRFGEVTQYAAAVKDYESPSRSLSSVNEKPLLH